MISTIDIFDTFLDDGLGIKYYYRSEWLLIRNTPPVGTPHEGKFLPTLHFNFVN